MELMKSGIALSVVVFIASCASYDPSMYSPEGMQVPDYPSSSYGYVDYSARIPQHIDTNEKVIVADPSVHTWGAYDENGELVRAGLITAGSDWCPDVDRPCRTQSGTFRIQSLGDADCKSRIFPVPAGGAPMPYCMFFNKGQALHGSYPEDVVEANVSHGCVRMHIEDAEWLRFNFASVGTKVIVTAY